MIRPLTFVSLLLAAASGLYLYQEKHRAEVLDRTIEHTLREVAVARERTGMLRAEWALLNEPDRLSQLAAQHLAGLQPLPPQHFVVLADLGAQLPPPGAPAATVAEQSPAANPAPITPAPVTLAAAPAAPLRVADSAPAALPAAPHPAPHPAPSTRVSSPRPATLRLADHAAPRATALSMPEPAPMQRPVFAPVLNAVAGPMAAPAAPRPPTVTTIGLVAARPPVPAVTSALGGYGRPALALPVPIRSN